MAWRLATNNVHGSAKRQLIARRARSAERHRLITHRRGDVRSGMAHSFYMPPVKHCALQRKSARAAPVVDGLGMAKRLQRVADKSWRRRGGDARGGRINIAPASAFCRALACRHRLIINYSSLRHISPYLPHCGLLLLPPLTGCRGACRIHAAGLALS